MNRLVVLIRFLYNLVVIIIIYFYDLYSKGLTLKNFLGDFLFTKNEF